MSLNRFVAATVAAVCVAAPLAAQQGIILNVNGGGYTHLANVSGTPMVDFKPGYNLGGSIGFEFNKYVGIHGDFTFARATARVGLAQLKIASTALAFDGQEFNRFFYGMHVEGRYPFSNGVTPFGFAGAGAVTVDQVGANTVPQFTRVAGMFGLGLGYEPEGSRVGVFAEGKTLVYQWDAVYNRTQTDVTYSIGLSYKIPL